MSARKQCITPRTDNDIKIVKNCKIKSFLQIDAEISPLINKFSANV